MAKGYRALDKDEYKKIKELTSIDGITKAQAARISGRSEATVNQIKISTSFNEYKERQRAYIQSSYQRRGLTPTGLKKDVEVSEAPTEVEVEEVNVPVEEPKTKTPTLKDWNVDSGYAVSKEARDSRSLERIAFALEELVKVQRNQFTKVVETKKKKTGIFG